MGGGPEGGGPEGRSEGGQGGWGWRVGPHRVGGPNWANRDPKGGRPEGWGAKGWGPKFRPLPPHFRSFFLSWRGLLVELLLRFKAEIHPNCAFGLIWEAPRRWGKGGGWGLRGGKERARNGRGGKNAKNFGPPPLGLHPLGPTLRAAPTFLVGPHPSGPTFLVGPHGSGPRRTTTPSPSLAICWYLPYTHTPTKEKTMKKKRKKTNKQLTKNANN